MADSTMARHCPSCSTRLDPEKHGRIEIDRCGQCGDLWFDRTELAAYIERSGPTSAAVDWGSPVKTPGSSVTALNCPRCETPTLFPFKWKEIPFNRCDRCSGVHVTREGLDQLLARAEKRQGIGGAKAIVGDTLGSVIDIIARSLR